MNSASVMSDNSTSNTLSLKWNEPDPRNGKILKYTVYYQNLGYVIGPDAFQEVPIESKDTAGNETNIVLDKLVPDSRYNVSIEAHTSVGPGNASTPVQFETPTGGKSTG